MIGCLGCAELVVKPTFGLVLLFVSGGKIGKRGRGEDVNESIALLEKNRNIKMQEGVKK